MSIDSKTGHENEALGSSLLPGTIGNELEMGLPRLSCLGRWRALFDGLSHNQTEV
jgi:hypothetical protein